MVIPRLIGLQWYSGTHAPRYLFGNPSWWFDGCAPTYHVLTSHIWTHVLTRTPCWFRLGIVQTIAEYQVYSQDRSGHTQRSNGGHCHSYTHLHPNCTSIVCHCHSQMARWLRYIYHWIPHVLAHVRVYVYIHTYNYNYVHASAVVQIYIHIHM